MILRVYTVMHYITYIDYHKTWKFDFGWVGGGTYPQFQGCGTGVCAPPPPLIFHSVFASIANPMLSSSRKAIM